MDLNGPQRPELIGYTTVYPNPSWSGQANWAIGPRTGSASGGPFTVRAVLVSRQYRPMLRIAPQLLAAPGLTYAFDYTKAGLEPRELYRLYYLVTDASGLVYKGHGDVKVE